jgi:hypothetical protein
VKKLVTKKASIRQPKPVPVRKAPRQPDLEGLGVESKPLDPGSMLARRRPQRYDVMAACSSAGESSDDTTLESARSCTSIQRRSREDERAQIMKGLSEDARERKKTYENLEAPLKKIREKSRANDANGLLYLAVQTAKPPPFGGLKLRQIRDVDRDREIAALIDVIREKREEVQKRRDSRSEDVIHIGAMEVPIGKCGHSEGSGQRELPRECERVPAWEDAEIIQLAAIAKSYVDCLPVEETVIRAGSSPSLDTGLFIFAGLPVDIPGVGDGASIADRLDCLDQFIEQGLGADIAERAKASVRSLSFASGDEDEFRAIFSSRALLCYFPFVQHYVFCEAFGKSPAR